MERERRITPVQDNGNGQRYTITAGILTVDGRFWQAQADGFMVEMTLDEVRAAGINLGPQWPEVPPQKWPQDDPAEIERSRKFWEEWNERDFASIKREMAEAGLVEMFEAAPQGQFAFTGTRDQWLKFIEKAREQWEDEL